MLQQTQVSHVARKYREFLKQFPTLGSLANAEARDVIRAWSGLGYNARALRLQQAARICMEKFHGRIPNDPISLEALPGIGRYTAKAIVCFAYHQDVAVVDTNIRRVLSRLFFRMRAPEERISEQKAWELAGQLVPRGRGRDWTLALMDLGSTICVPHRPQCKRCPGNSVCRSAFGLEKQRTVPQVRREPSHDGTPNRIYRGRIVEVLRRLDDERTVGLRLLGKKIKTRSGQVNEAWLRDLLLGLERDGLVRLVSGASGIRVSLP